MSEIYPGPMTSRCFDGFKLEAVGQWWIAGVPATGGSKKLLLQPHKGRREALVNYKIVDDCARNAGWRDAVAAQVIQTFAGPPFPARTPLIVHAAFVLPTPKSFRTADGQISPHMRPLHCTKPDASKLWRAAEDALTGILWYDDANIVQQTVDKFYTHQWEGPEEPGLWLAVWRVVVPSTWRQQTRRRDRKRAEGG